MPISPSQAAANQPIDSGHGVIIKYMQYLNYKSEYDFGLCAGFRGMGLQAIQAKQIDHFNKRNKFMLKLFKEATDLVGENDEARGQFILEKIDEVKEKVKQKLPLNTEEQFLIEIPALCDGIQVHQHTYQHPELFPQKTEMQDFAEANKIILPTSIEKNAYSYSKPIVGSYTKAELASYFLCLKNILDENGISERVSFTVENINHATGASYENGKWLFVNPNFDAEKGEFGIIECDSPEALAEIVFKGFESKDPLTLATGFVALQKENNDISDKIISELETNEDWLRIHRPKDSNHLSRKDSRGTNMLLLALIRGDLEAASFCLENQPLSIRDRSDLLAKAAITPNSGEKIKLLLKENVNPYFEWSGDPQPPFFKALKSQSLENIKAFIDCGINVNAHNSLGETSLIFIRKFSKKTEITQVLLENGANVNQHDNNFNTALHYAVESKDIPYIELLLKNGADPNLLNDDNQSPLHKAFNNDDQNVIDLLYAYGADHDIDTSAPPKFFLDDQDPIFFSIFNSELDKVQELASKAKDVTPRLKYAESTPLHFVFTHFPELPAIQALIPGSDINALDVYGQTPLHRACEVDNDMSLVAELLKVENINVSIRDNNGNLPVDILYQRLAADPDNEHLCADLFNCGLDGKDLLERAIFYWNLSALNKDFKDIERNEGLDQVATSLPLMYVASGLNILKYYLQLPNVDINAKDADGNTLFSLALKGFYDVKRPHIPEVIQLLLDNGADPKLTSATNRVNPLNTELADLLKKSQPASVVTSGMGLFNRKSEAKPVAEPADQSELLKRSGPPTPSG